MRHAKARYQLNRFTSWRRATLRSIAQNLLLYQGINTTLTKAKAVRPLVERLILLAKDNSLSARRTAFRILGSHKLVGLLFNEIGPRFADRHSGFTRIINFGTRRGDNAQMAVLELVVIKKRERKRPLKEKEVKVEGERPSPAVKEKPVEEKPPLVKKPSKKFLGGIRKIFKKERDSL